MVVTPHFVPKHLPPGQLYPLYLFLYFLYVTKVTEVTTNKHGNSRSYGPGYTVTPLTSVTPVTRDPTPAKLSLPPVKSETHPILNHFPAHNYDPEVTFRTVAWHRFCNFATEQAKSVPYRDSSIRILLHLTSTSSRKTQLDVNWTRISSYKLLQFRACNQLFDVLRAHAHVRAGNKVERSSRCQDRTHDQRSSRYKVLQLFPCVQF